MSRKPSVWVLVAASSLWLLTVMPAVGQGTLPPLPVDPSILLVNPDRVFERSETGRAVTAQIEERRMQVIARSDAVSTAFAEEERALTALRLELPRDEFVARAEDFDRRVQAARSAQDLEADTFARDAERFQRQFFSALNTIYAELLQETGAQAVLDIRSVLLADQSLDVTLHVIARLDEASARPSLDAIEPDE
ncbi:MAG: OmpH family outer membrane protein [Pseudomonadota bacterium]